MEACARAGVEGWRWEGGREKGGGGRTGERISQLGGRGGGGVGCAGGRRGGGRLGGGAGQRVGSLAPPSV